MRIFIVVAICISAVAIAFGAQGAVFQVTEAQQRWWAYQPIRDHLPPEVSDASWPINEIDRFILAELEARDMQPAEPAQRRAWIRRATFDLTGLPPTPAEVEAFLADDPDHAYANAVDRLLASPAHGQRWARHWLDVARYADCLDANPQTRVANYELTEAWRYRDWVVDSLNSDMPFDQFVEHQIAGDLLPSPTGDEVYPAGLIATTFLANGVWDTRDADKKKLVSDIVDDQIDTIGKAFLGLTLGCARCHDHMYDPVSTEDYYGLAGIFYSSRILDHLGAKDGNVSMYRLRLAPQSVAAAWRAQMEQLREIETKLAELDEKSPKPPEDDPERLTLVAQRDKLQGELLPEPPLAMVTQEGGTPGGLFPNIQDVPIHIRGSYTRLGPVVPRRLPRFFAGDDQPPITSGSGRREVARWLVSKDNPLTPRVIVNRIWQWHFGEGLVRTPNNFGLLSQPPTHPALLDWLAVRFVEDGWSLKNLHRRIMLSATYRQSSSIGREQLALDPDNRWVARFTARRLEAEAIRDAMLFVAGELDPSQGGPAGDDLTISRRSLYVQRARWNGSKFATLFDVANPDVSTEKRVVSTVAPQALFLMNHEFVFAQAKRLAERWIREGPDVERARIQQAFRMLFGRPASAKEIGVARQMLAETGGTDAEIAWADLAHVLLCSNEFVYLD